MCWGGGYFLGLGGREGDYVDFRFCVLFFDFLGGAGDRYFEVY